MKMIKMLAIEELSYATLKVGIRKKNIYSADKK